MTEGNGPRLMKRLGPLDGEMDIYWRRWRHPNPSEQAGLAHYMLSLSLSLTAGVNVSIHLLQVRVPSLIVMETLSIIDQH